MQVWIHSPFASISEGLKQLVANLGFEPCDGPSPLNEVALWDLTNAGPPFPGPPDIPTLALVSGEDHVVDLLHRGYRGYLGRTEGGEVVRRALLALRRGEMWAERRILTQTIQSFIQPQLTAREEEIFGFIAKGWSNRAIARELNITERTVKAHASRLYEKLGVSSRVELIVHSHDGGFRDAFGTAGPAGTMAILGD